MNTSILVTEIRKVADDLIAENIYNDPESAFDAALKIVDIQVNILTNANDIVGKIRFLEEAVTEIRTRQDV